MDKNVQEYISYALLELACNTTLYIDKIWLKTKISDETYQYTDKQY